MAMSIQVQREQNGQALETGLTTLLRHLSAVSAVRRIILFGSCALGHRDLFTDLDILVVMDSDSGFVERTVSLARHISVGTPLDLLVYTPEEMRRMRDRPFIRHAMATGRVLYERNPAN